MHTLLVSHDVQRFSRHHLASSLLLTDDIYVNVLVHESVSTRSVPSLDTFGSSLSVTTGQQPRHWYDSDQDSLASVCRFRAPARPSDLGAVAAEGAGGYLADEVLATLDAEVTKAGL